MMPIGDPPDGFFYPILKIMIDSYNPEAITWEISEEGFEQIASVIDFVYLRWSNPLKTISFLTPEATYRKKNGGRYTLLLCKLSAHNSSYLCL